MSNIELDDFDVIYKVYNEYFQVYCNEKKDFTHLVGSKNGLWLPTFILITGQKNLLMCMEKCTVSIIF